MTPVFVAVRGRARLRVEGLRRRPDLAVRLEGRIAASGAVRSAHASAVTGNVLIIFDVDKRDLRRLVADIARYAAEVAHTNGTAPAVGGTWHAKTAAVTVADLRTSPIEGLSSDEAAARLTRMGANHLPAPQPKSALAIVTGHLTSLPVMLLGAAAALSIATGAVIDAVVILAVVGANAAVGYVTESRVERILTSLQNAVVPQAFTRRDGRELMIPAAALVPGDLLVLKTGHDVPADARLVAVDGLAVDESALTGESVPVTKAAVIVCDDKAPVAERRNMVFAGTTVAEGSGLAVVTATGQATELGRIRSLVAETSTPPTPLERQLDRMGRHLVGISLGFCGAALGLGLLRGVPVLEMVRAAISLAVAAVPEGLPAVATTTLALGVQRMMQRRVLVRRLAAVESLGATTVICADKTGTLTENRMRVELWHLGGREYRALNGSTNGSTNGDGRYPLTPMDTLMARALTIGAMCNEADLGEAAADIRGSSTEAALLTAALESGLDYRRLRRGYRLIGLRRRLEGQNWMAAIHATGGDRKLITVKGAPEEVLERSARWLDADGERPLTPTVKQEILATNSKIAAQGLRVLGLAFKEVRTSSDTTTLDELTWVGLVGLSDPVRPGVREAIEACRHAGIRTVILTGDQAATAAAIGRELGLGRNGDIRVLEASQLEHIDTPDLRTLVRNVDVFARVTPAHKYHIVRALQASGEVVTMTGDGINDAAALRAADIGVAMGVRGTDVARDVADVVLLDDDFTALLRALEQGRTIHANIGNALTFLLSTNFSEILFTLGALSVGIARPLSAIQFLWINLISDVFPALALAVEPPEPGVMDRPPRNPAEPILSRAAMGGIAADASLLAAAALGVQAVGGAGAHATTLAFSTLTSAQLVHALNCRSNPTGLRRSPLLMTVLGASLGFQFLTTTAPPLRRLLGTTPLSPASWALVAGGALLPMLVRRLRDRGHVAPHPVNDSTAAMTAGTKETRSWQGRSPGSDRAGLGLDVVTANDLRRPRPPAPAPRHRRPSTPSSLASRTSARPSGPRRSPASGEESAWPTFSAAALVRPRGRRSAERSRPRKPSSGRR